jgi:acetate kinase
LKLDPEKNLQSVSDQNIAAADSSVSVLVIRAEEDWAIAREYWNLQRGEGSGSGSAKTV